MNGTAPKQPKRDIDTLAEGSKEGRKKERSKEGKKEGMKESKQASKKASEQASKKEEEGIKKDFFLLSLFL